MEKQHNYKVRIAYHIVETREFSFNHENDSFSPDDILDFCEYELGFDTAKVVDREVLRVNLVDPISTVKPQ